MKFPAWVGRSLFALAAVLTIVLAVFVVTGCAPTDDRLAKFRVTAHRDLLARLLDGQCA